MDADFIRKVADNEVGRRYLERADIDLYDDPLTCVEFDKLASVEDPELLKIAESMLGDTLENYEAFGGKFLQKEALFGVGVDVASFSETKDMKGTLNIGFPHLLSVNARHKPSGIGAGVGMLGPVISWSPGTMAEHERAQKRESEKTASPLWVKLAFGTPMFQMNPIQTPGPVGGGPSAVGAGAMKPPAMPAPSGGQGMKSPGSGGGQGMSNPMQQASTPQIPGTTGVKTGMAKEADAMSRAVRKGLVSARDVNFRGAKHVPGPKGGYGKRSTQGAWTGSDESGSEVSRWRSTARGKYTRRDVHDTPVDTRSLKNRLSEYKLNRMTVAR